MQVVIHCFILLLLLRYIFFSSTFSSFFFSRVPHILIIVHICLFNHSHAQKHLSFDYFLRLIGHFNIFLFRIILYIYTRREICLFLSIKKKCMQYSVNISFVLSLSVSLSLPFPTSTHPSLTHTNDFERQREYARRFSLCCSIHFLLTHPFSLSLSPFSNAFTHSFVLSL